MEDQQHEKICRLKEKFAYDARLSELMEEYTKDLTITEGGALCNALFLDLQFYWARAIRRKEKREDKA